MDKRWRNLGIILIIVIVAIALFTYKDSIFVLKNPGETKFDEYVSLLEKNDINYVEFKLALELFERSVDPSKLDTIYNESNDLYIRKLVDIERRQNAFMDDLENFYLRDLETVCMEESAANDIYSEGMLIYSELGEILEDRNDLEIDLRSLAGNFNTIGDSILEFSAMCYELDSLTVFSDE